MIHRPVTVLLAVLTALAAVPTVIRLVGDHQRIPLVLLVSALPYALVPLVVLLVLQVVLGRRRIALLTGLAVALNAAWLVPLYVGDGVPPGRALTVVTANLHFGEADPFALVRLVRDQRVDVLGTQELTEAAVDDLRGAGLGEELPYFVGDPFRAADGSGLWSRYPVVEQPDWSLRFKAPGAVVRAPGGDVLVRVVHAYPPVGDEGGVYRRDVRGIVADAHALPDDRPVVLLGDFNATLDSSFLQELQGDRYRDAGEVAGSGLVRTWGAKAGSVKLLDLDHVFVDSRVAVRSTAVIDVPGSDHDALLARLVLH